MLKLCSDHFKQYESYMPFLGSQEAYINEYHDVALNKKRCKYCENHKIAAALYSIVKWNSNWESPFVMSHTAYPF